ncbi:MAG: sigma-54-dependent Fis family transcriptional regulator, partial [Betaproteobacteria bacterium HGW-Betaproteobacteria-19]
VVDIRTPPLRERSEDIPDLMRHFMDLLSVQLGVAPLALSHGLVSSLAAYEWPGNVRELRNLVERSLILGTFPTEILPATTRMNEAADAELLTLEEVEKRHILRVVEACGGNKSEAARRLGVARKTLERKFADWGEDTRPSFAAV